MKLLERSDSSFSHTLYYCIYLIYCRNIELIQLSHKRAIRSFPYFTGSYFYVYRLEKHQLNMG